MSSLVSQRSPPKEKESSPKVDRVVGFSRSRNTPSSRRGVRRRHQSQSPTRVTLNEDAVPALALSLASTAMSLSSDSSPNSGKIYPRGGKQEMSQNRTRDLPNSRTRGHRSGSASDGEEEEDDREEAVPMAEVFNETAFRKMYVCSDFAAKKATGKLKTSHIPSEKPPMLCKHGLKLGICTESECCTIVKAKITRSDRRMSGKYTGRKLVEYHILVTFENCQASIWHRYSGFRSFYELFVLKHGADEFSMFPRRHLNKWSKAVTSERLVALDAFLRKIVENPKYRQDPLFKDFLSVDENARRQFYEPSATQNHDIEIRQLSKEISNMKSSALANFKSSKKKSDKTSDEFREKK